MATPNQNTVLTKEEFELKILDTSWNKKEMCLGLKAASMANHEPDESWACGTFGGWWAIYYPESFTENKILWYWDKTGFDVDDEGDLEFEVNKAWKNLKKRIMLVEKSKKKEAAKKQTIEPKKEDTATVVTTWKDLSYHELKKNFEETRFKCEDNGLYYQHDGTKIIKRTESRMRSDFRQYKFKSLNGSKKSFIELWINDEDLRVFKSVGFYPQPTPLPDRCFNLWMGFDIENTQSLIDAVDFSVLLNHIHRIAGDCVDYVDRWIAMLLQKPGLKQTVSLLFKSKSGRGKDVFYSILEAMIGEQHCLIPI